MCNPKCDICKGTEIDEVYVCKECLEKLQVDQRMLMALEALGVDNWEGYEDAVDMFNGE